MAKRNTVSTATASAAPSRQRIWEIIRALHADGQRITTRDAWLLIPDSMPRTRVNDYFRSLAAGGYLECLNPERKPGVAAEFALIRDVGVEAPRVRRDGSVPPVPGREQLWRTLRIIGDFTAAGLAEAASTPESPIARNTAEEYCHFLQKAGYLQLSRPGSPGIAARYRLVHSRWTGPLAPMIQRTKCLFDPNTGETVYARVTKTEGGEP
ncbi:hypothetical protein QWY79_03470 [Halomonas sabkhae]|uniref:hypothetical protein n=1 Tax=Halomonas sabkhae TaxID=626223 RepID=UPI0025B31A17|nr:hypothetical protein [Halomonas sabkhae]MDN3524322.1 hypothetical protein [Halomonas sabkhae]